MQKMSWFIFLVNPTSVSQVCKIFQNFPLRWILFFYKIEVFIWKFEHETVYVCLVGGVVIFDESWVGKGIDSRVNTVHGPVFSDAEVKPQRTWPILNIGLLISTIEPVESFLSVVYFVSVIGSSWLISSVRCCFFSSMSKDSKLSSGLCAEEKRFFIGLELLNWWVLPVALNIRYNFLCEDILCS